MIQWIWSQYQIHAMELRVRSKGHWEDISFTCSSPSMLVLILNVYWRLHRTCQIHDNTIAEYFQSHDQTIQQAYITPTVLAQINSYQVKLLILISQLSSWYMHAASWSALDQHLTYTFLEGEDDSSSTSVMLVLKRPVMPNMPGAMSHALPCIRIC